jgi:hypothetical protein
MQNSWRSRRRVRLWATGTSRTAARALAPAERVEIAVHRG